MSGRFSPSQKSTSKHLTLNLALMTLAQLVFVSSFREELNSQAQHVRKIFRRRILVKNDCVDSGSEIVSPLLELVVEILKWGLVQTSVPVLVHQRTEK